MTPPHTPLVSRASIATIAVLAATTCAVMTPAQAAVPHAHAAVPHARTTTVVPGVKVWTQTWTTASGTQEHSALMSVDLTDKHVSINAVPALGHLNGQYRTVKQMIVADHAVAGINGDFFHLGTQTGVPTGGLVSSSTLLKTPEPGYAANFMIRADGTAAIGTEQFTGTVTVSRKNARPLSSYNTVTDASAGRITLLTPAMISTELPTGCTLAVGRVKAGTLTVTRQIAKVPNHSTLAQLASGQAGLLSCGASGSWLRTYLTAGRSATVTGSLSTANPRAVVSGAQVLISNGKGVTDKTGHHIVGPHPETFACVSADRLHLLLGTVDADQWNGDDGVTMAQLRTFLLAKGSTCTYAMAFDGGGSSVLDYRQGTTGNVTTLNHLAYGYERSIPDALLISYT